jgi:UDP-N-acetylmuramyl tripeptide synthase
MNNVNFLEDLNIEWKRGSLDVEIKGIAYDSRLVKKDYMFVAVRGYSVDGHDYIKDAVTRGATVIVAEHPFEITDSARYGIGTTAGKRWPSYHLRFTDILLSVCR